MFKSEFAQGLIDNQLTEAYFRIANQHKQLAWAGVNSTEIKADLLADHVLTDKDLNQTQSYQLKREQVASWLAYQHQQDDLTVNLAARYEQLTTQITDADNKANTAEKHNLVLLSANALYQVQENWQLRLIGGCWCCPITVVRVS